VRPLLGGYYAWKDLGFPLVDVLPDVEAEANTFGKTAEEIA